MRIIPCHLIRYMMSAIAFIAIFSAYSQVPDSLYKDSICAYTWNDSVGGCTEVLECIYPSQWNDTVITVPRNITHISPNGLKLCLDDLNLITSADIIYILDLSDGMLPDARPMGDRFKKRDDAIEAGFNYQINTSPQSHAGYIGFGTGLVQDHLMPPVNVQARQGQLTLMAALIRNFVENEQSAGGKDYKEALNTAIEWLQDPLLCPHEIKTIIFISNGEPDNGKTPSAEQLSFLSNNRISVHSIHLGNGSMGSALSNLADQTGGRKVLVPPRNNDTLETAVVQILESVIKDLAPTSITVTNQSTGSSANGLIDQWTLVDDTVWTGPMDKTVGLQPELNQIQLNAYFQTSDRTVDTSLTFEFYIDVGGEDRYTSECFYCWHRSSLQVLVSDMPVDTLTWQDREYTIRFLRYGRDTLDQIDVVVNTIQKGDEEVIALKKWSHDGEKFIYEATVPFAVLGASRSATPGNTITEAEHNDQVTLFWRHPVEVLDTAYTVVGVSGPPNRMAIHNKTGQPDSASRYVTAPATDTIIAGVPAQLYAKVFAGDTWLDEYETNQELSKLITWKVTDVATGLADSSIGAIVNDSGSNNTYLPVKAFYTVDIVAALSMGAVGTISETIRFYIKSGGPKQLVIENTSDPAQTKDLNSPSHWSPIEFFGNQITDTAYAILRDSLGNWVGPAAQANWISDDTSIVTVVPGPGVLGTITKNPATPSGQTLIHATQSGMEDTAIVKTYAYQVDSIRLVVIQGGTDTVDIDSLILNTNDDTTLHVIGRRDDFGIWISVDAQWGITPPATEQNPPPASSRWFFSPSRPDSGVIYVNFSEKHDTVHYVFTVGPPIEADFTILTPDSLRIAGEVIQGIVSIKNEDGLVPGVWKYDGVNEATYTDILSDGTDDPVNPIHPQWMPFCQTDQSSSVFNDKAAQISQWFTDGVDTIDFVIYYAPDTAAPHQLTVQLGSLTASTDPFIIMSDALDTIVLLPNTLPDLTSTDPPLYLTAYGYDVYGNRKPGEIFWWRNDQTLVDFTINELSAQIYIDPSEATQLQEGFVYVSGVGDTSVTNKIYLKVLGASPNLKRAVTCDYNGNGFLDAIELHLNKAVTVPLQYDPDSIMVQKSLSESIFFTVDSLVVVPLSDGKKIVIYLDEKDKSIDKGNKPETGWTPYLTISNCDNLKDITKRKCADGAAPVIWQAGFASDQITDEITVIMSEHFYNYNGAPFMSTGSVPSGVFNVWTLTDSVFVKHDSILAGIEQFQDQQGRWVTFKITNGAVISPEYYFNLNHQQGYIADANGNIPTAINQKVRISNTIGIRVINEPVKSRLPGIIAIPNPVSTREKVQFLIQEQQHQEGQFRIYDALGNCVDEREVPPGVTNLVWDLRNRNGRNVGAGTYLVVFTYKNKNTGEGRVVKVMVGIRDE